MLEYHYRGLDAFILEGSLAALPSLIYDLCLSSGNTRKDSNTFCTNVYTLALISFLICKCISSNLTVNSHKVPIIDFNIVELRPQGYLNVFLSASRADSKIP